MFSMIVFAFFMKDFKCLNTALLAIVFEENFVFIVFFFLAASHMLILCFFSCFK